MLPYVASLTFFLLSIDFEEGRGGGEGEAIIISWMYSREI
jgi:hypothetical protein